VINALINIKKRAKTIKGYKIIEEPPILRHFTAKLAPIQHDRRNGRGTGKPTEKGTGKRKIISGKSRRKATRKRNPKLLRNRHLI
jgi:hypothetical protein